MSHQAYGRRPTCLNERRKIYAPRREPKIGAVRRKNCPHTLPLKAITRGVSKGEGRSVQSTCLDVASADAVAGGPVCKGQRCVVWWLPNEDEVVERLGVERWVKLHSPWDKRCLIVGANDGVSTGCWGWKRVSADQTLLPVV